jgi:hypothetical protein
VWWRWFLVLAGQIWVRFPKPGFAVRVDQGRQKAVSHMPDGLLLSPG